MAQQAKKKSARPAKRSKTLKAGPAADKASVGKPKAGRATAAATATDKTASVGTKRGASPLGGAPEALSQRLAQVERERNDALRQLAEAHQRIKQLEDTQVQVVNRIDWVVDSLHTLKSDTL